MHLTIVPPAQFKNAAGLLARYDRFDPRGQPFDVERVDVDLRDCEFVRPPAAVWCLIYLALASSRGAECRLLVPSSLGVCMYLKALGMFDILHQCGIEVDDRDVHSRCDRHIVLPLTHFEATADAAELANYAFERLREDNVGAVNLTSVVTELFSELALNAAQHSESPIGAYACIQFAEYRQASRFVCVVGDGGIGVLASLHRNEGLRRRVCYDWDALELAVRERISGTGDPHRGIGLYGVSEDLRHPGHSLLLHSGLGSLEVNERVESRARRTRLFPGTLAYIAIPA